MSRLSFRPDSLGSRAWSKRWRQSNSAGLKYFAYRSLGRTAKYVTFAVDGDFHLNQIVQVPDDVRPFRAAVLAGQPVLQLLAQQERQKRTEHMTTYRFVALMEDGPGIQQRLHRAEDILDHPQLLILQRYFRGG